MAESKPKPGATSISGNPIGAPTIKIKLLQDVVCRAGAGSEPSGHKAGEVLDTDPIEARGLIAQGKAEPAPEK